MTSTTDSGLQFVEVMRFFKFSADQLLVFNWGSLFSKRNTVISCEQLKPNYFFKNLTEASLLTLAKSVYYNEKWRHKREAKKVGAVARMFANRLFDPI